MNTFDKAILLTMIGLLYFCLVILECRVNALKRRVEQLEKKP